jgi:transcriptional regulator with XRE-family HTH domain
MKGVDFGQAIGLSKQQISFIENDERQLNADHIRRMKESFCVDPRWFFGEIPNIEEAFIDRQDKNGRTISERVADQLEQQNAVIRELQLKVEGPRTDSEDKVVEKVRTSANVYKVVEKIYALDPPILQRIDDMITGFLWSKTDSERGSAEESA